MRAHIALEQGFRAHFSTLLKQCQVVSLVQQRFKCVIISVVLPTWPVILVKIRGNVVPIFNFGFQVVYSCIMCKIV